MSVQDKLAFSLAPNMRRAIDYAAADAGVSRSRYCAEAVRRRLVAEGFDPGTLPASGEEAARQFLDRVRGALSMGADELLENYGVSLADFSDRSFAARREGAQRLAVAIVCNDFEEQLVTMADGRKSRAPGATRNRKKGAGGHD